MSINAVSVSGRLTRDPELRATQSGTQVLTVPVAVNERVRSASGQWEDRASYVDCVVFGRRAEALCDLLRKGDKVAVSGRLRQSSWEARDGSRRSKVEVVADEVELMGAPRGASAGPAAHGAAGAYGEDGRL